MNEYLESDRTYTIPDWVYSYMLGTCISNETNQQDRHDLLVGINLDNTADLFDDTVYLQLYEISKAWLQKIPQSKKNHRPPTIFGESHVVKSIRLMTII